MDYVRIIKLYDNHHNEIPVIKGLPKDEEYRKFCIKDADAYHAIVEDKAVLLFQCLVVSDMEIWITDYHIFSPVKLYFIADCERLEFHNMVEGWALYRLGGFGWQRIESGQYNLIYLPTVRNKVHFSTHARTLGIHISKEKLFALSEKYPVLKQIITKIEQKQTGSLYPKVSENTLHSRYLLGQIIMRLENNNPTSREIPKLINDLIGNLCTVNTTKLKYKYGDADVQSLYDAAKSIEENLGDENIYDYLRIKGLYPDKVREGFQALFGMPPKQYIAKTKIDKAISLINTDKRLYDIAIEAGYGGVRQLRAAFKKQFGCSIREHKRQSNNDKA